VQAGQTPEDGTSKHRCGPGVGAVVDAHRLTGGVQTDDGSSIGVEHSCVDVGLKPNTVQLRSMVIRGRRSGWGHGLWCERLAAHLRTLRLTTRGLARRRRLGLIRWVSLVIAHCHRVAIASWL
jgi:hypothetical protein